MKWAVLLAVYLMLSAVGVYKFCQLLADPDFWDDNK